MSDERNIYRVLFFERGRVCEIYAKEVLQGGLYGFIEVQRLIFGAKTDVVIDPSEEQLRQEFEGVKRFYIPIHAVIRIDEVEKEGAGRITESKDKDAKVTPFPVPLYSPRESD